MALYWGKAILKLLGDASFRNPKLFPPDINHQLIHEVGVYHLTNG